MKTKRKILLFTILILSVLILFPPLLLSQTRLTASPTGEATAASDGFCCVNGQVISATQAQCKQKRGQYFSTRAEALRHCKPSTIFCCINGKVSEVSPEQCKKSKGVAYRTGNEAKKNCKPEAVYCCLNGNIKKVSPGECRKMKGIPYTTAAEAKRKCRPEAVYCCLKGSVKKVSAGECKKKKGIAYKTERDARKNCGWCCADSKVFPATPETCKRNGGNYYTSTAQADKECRKQPQCCIKGKLFTYSKRECDLKKGTYYRSYGEAQKQCRVERTQPPIKPSRLEQTSSKPGRLARLMPDLIVSTIRLIKDCKIEITIKNIGTSGVPAAGYDLNKGAGIQMYNGGKAWGGIRLGAIDPSGRLKTPGNSVKYVWFPQAVNLALGAGTHSIKVVVDINNAVAELNENNNSKTSRLVCEQPVSKKEKRKMQKEVSKRTDGVPKQQTKRDLNQPPPFGTLTPLRDTSPPDQNQPQNGGVFDQPGDPAPVAQSAVRADIPDLSLSEGISEPTPIEPADLALEMSMSPQNAVIGVDTINVTLKVTNIGGRTTSANTTLTLAFSDHPYVNHPYFKLDQWTIPQLGAGEHIVTYQQIIPEHYTRPGESVSYTVEPGTYRFMAGIDTSTLASDETTNYSNDTAELIFQLTLPPRPDLVVCFSKFVSTRANGTQYVVYSPVVKNIGNAPSGSVNLRFYIEDKGVQNYTVPGLPAVIGEYSGINYQTVWYVRGDRDYSLWVDSNNDVVESNEVNNTIVGTIHVFGIFAADALPTSPIQCSNEPGMAN